MFIYNCDANERSHYFVNDMRRLLFQDMCSLYLCVTAQLRLIFHQLKTLYTNHMMCRISP